jgi:pimeloyl-ACP methyl ester carboxylesterase
MNLKPVFLSISFLSLAFAGCADDPAAAGGSSSDEVAAPRPPNPDFFPFDTGEAVLHLRRDGIWGSPIVLLHGFPDGAEVWEPIARNLGHEFQVYTPDLRGYDLSSKPADPSAYEMARLVADVAAVVELANSETGEPVLLVGHDWGAVPMFVYASQHPELVRGVVSVNGVHPDVLRREFANNPLQRQAFFYVNLFSVPGIEFALAANNFNDVFAGMVNGQGLPVLSPAEQDAYRAVWSQPGTMTGMLNWYRANMFPDPTFATGPGFSAAVPTNLASNKPTLFLWGERDPALLPGNLEGLDNYLSRLTIKRYPENGHWLMRERPEEIEYEIGDFLRSIPWF